MRANKIRENDIGINLKDLENKYSTISSFVKKAENSRTLQISEEGRVKGWSAKLVPTNLLVSESRSLNLSIINALEKSESLGGERHKYTVSYKKINKEPTIILAAEKKATLNLMLTELGKYAENKSEVEDVVKEFFPSYRAGSSPTHAELKPDSRKVGAKAVGLAELMAKCASKQPEEFREALKFKFGISIFIDLKRSVNHTKLNKALDDFGYGELLHVCRPKETKFGGRLMGREVKVAIIGDEIEALKAINEIAKIAEKDADISSKVS